MSFFKKILSVFKRKKKTKEDEIEDGEGGRRGEGAGREEPKRETRGGREGEDDRRTGGEEKPNEKAGTQRAYTQSDA